MPLQLTVLGLDPAVVAALKRRAAEHGRSMEAEHREVLREALLPDVRTFGSARTPSAAARAGTRTAPISSARTGIAGETRHRQQRSRLGPPRYRARTASDCVACPMTPSSS